MNDSSSQNKTSIKIAIADGQTILRQALAALLELVDGWKVVAQTGKGEDVLSVVENHAPDVLIIDTSMPNLGGTDALMRLHALKDSPAILVLSSRSDGVSANDAIRAGASGYITKSADTNELLFAITSLMKGQIYLTPSVTTSIVNKRNENSGPNTSVSFLTPRERNIFILLGQGYPNREIARMLHISPRTIDAHRGNIMKKLSLKSNADLVKLALQSGLVE